MIFLNVPKVRPSDIVKVQQQSQQRTNAELEHEQSCVKRKSSRSANLRRNKLFRMIFDGLHVSI